MSEVDERSLPSSVQRIREVDSDLYEAVAADVSRLTQTGRAMAWAWSRLPDLVAASGPTQVLDAVVAAAREVTDAPTVWALRWSGEIAKGQASVRAFAGTTEDVPSPNEISNTVIARVAKEGKAVWSDDASADARFTAAESVQAFTLRSVGCIPLGDHAVLYLHDPENPARFSATERLRLGALCRLAAPFLEGPVPGTAKPGRVRPVPGMVGDSAAMGLVYDAIRAFAAMPWPVLVLGESGVGKEAVARALHELSPLAGRPFVAVNCGAIPSELAESTLFGHERGAFTGADRLHRGLAEQVRDGTLFLDEVGELEPKLQVKLLRVLQERTFRRVGGDTELPFRGRIVAATLREVDDPEQRGAFREDLYYRLAACVLRVPALRERRDDIPALARFLVERSRAEITNAPEIALSRAAESALAVRAFPGNVRDLENVLRSAIARSLFEGSATIEPRHLEERRRTADEPRLEDGEDLQAATDRFQRALVNQALEAEGGSRTKAAERLGVSRQWLHRLITRWETP